MEDHIQQTLGQLRTGEYGRVCGFHPCDKSYKAKLLAMGLLPGTEFKIVRVAPLGDPIEIQIRGFSLSLRIHEAASLIVEKLESVDVLS